MFEYNDICDSTFGASDYIALARHFDTIILKNLVKVSKDNKNAMRRLILFIDELYNNNVKLYCSAERDINGIFGSLKQSDDD